MVHNKVGSWSWLATSQLITRLILCLRVRIPYWSRALLVHQLLCRSATIGCHSMNHWQKIICGIDTLIDMYCKYWFLLMTWLLDTIWLLNGLQTGQWNWGKNAVSCWHCWSVNAAFHIRNYIRCIAYMEWQLATTGNCFINAGQLTWNEWTDLYHIGSCTKQALAWLLCEAYVRLIHQLNCVGLSIIMSTASAFDVFLCKQWSKAGSPRSWYYY